MKTALLSDSKRGKRGKKRKPHLDPLEKTTHDWAGKKEGEFYYLLTRGEKGKGGRELPVVPEAAEGGRDFAGT